MLTSFSTPDGVVFDVLPGVVTAETYLEALLESRAFVQGLHDRPFLERVAEARHATHVILGTVPVFAATSSPKGGRAPGAGEALTGLALPGTEMPPSLSVALAKTIVELPLVTSLSRGSGRVPGLLQDDLSVRLSLRPRARALLAQCSVRSPDTITPRIFREVLLIDLDDPDLGLGPGVFDRRPWR